MVALVRDGRPEDLVGLSELVARYGHRAVAEAQAEVDRRLDTGPGMPYATRFVALLAERTKVADELRASGLSRREAVEIAECCCQCAFWLVLAEITPSLGTKQDSVEAAVECVDRGDITAWRAQLGIIAMSPWHPYPDELRELLEAGDRPEHAGAVEAAARYFRDRLEQRERELVAREIRRLVAMSGLSQREFAAKIGTSASRLSTYVTGTVTPSAAMLVRIRRVAVLVQNTT